MRVSQLLMIIFICSISVLIIKFTYEKLYEHNFEGEFGALKGEIVEKKEDVENDKIHYFFKLRKNFDGKNKECWIETSKKKYNGYKLGEYYE